MNNPQNDLERYRALAAEAFAAGEQMTDPRAVLILQRIALAYDRLALMAEARMLDVRRATLLQELEPDAGLA